MGEPAIVAQAVRTIADARDHSLSHSARDQREARHDFAERIPAQSDIAEDQLYTSEPFEDPTPIPILPLSIGSSEATQNNFWPCLQVMGAFLFMFCSWGLIGCFGTFFVFYKDTLITSHTPSELAWIGSVQHFIAVIVGILTSKWVDYGYMFFMCLGGSILIVFGVMMDAQCKSYVEIFFSHGVSIGVGAGLIYLPCITCCSEYFTRRRGVALGIATLGSSVGSIIYPIIFNRLQPKIGYQWTMRTIGFMIVGLCVIALMVIRPRKVSIEPRQLFARHVFKDKIFVVFTLGYLIGNFGLYVPGFFLPSYGKHSNFSKSVFPYTTSFAKAGGIAGRLLSILLTHRIGVFGLYIPRIFLAAAIALSWIAVQKQGSFVVVCVLYGFLTGSLLSSTPMIVTRITDDVCEINMRLCVASFISAFGTLAGPPIAGALLEVEPPDYLRAQIFSGVFLFMSGMFMVVARIMKIGINPFTIF